MQYKISHPTKTINALLKLPTSKSISNRLLIIRALSGTAFPIHQLSDSDDTKALLDALQLSNPVIDVGAAGTSSRFLTAFLSLTQGEWELRGSDRLHERPIKILVDTLLELGADIRYKEKPGFLPLLINGKNLQGGGVKISGGISSQFISALLMIAPVLEKGLTIELEGDLVSKPYVLMTLSLMNDFGIEHTWEDNIITIPNQTYKAIEYTVEADWSAASYYFLVAALAKKSKLLLDGLFPKSLQGDQAIQPIIEQLGIRSFFMQNWLHLIKAYPTTNHLTFDFTECPDLAQTVVVLCAALGIPATFSGLQTLRRKETDRIAALQTELAKVGAQFTSEDDIHFQVKGKVSIPVNTPVFRTYEDHRMAMSFAPLALVLPEIIIDEPMVVSKSHPLFWEHLKAMGFTVDLLQQDKFI